MSKSRANRVERSILDLVTAFDHHQHLLRENMHAMWQDPAHVKLVASELRVLVCLSSGTEGLLWRLVETLEVSDVIPLISFVEMDRDHPLAKGTRIALPPFTRKLWPGASRSPEPISLRQVIKQCEAVYLSSMKDCRFTHEKLISAISNQIGGSHESEQLDPDLIRLGQILINEREIYFQILGFDSELVLQVGERILEKAEQTLGYRRAKHPKNCGNSSLALKLHLKEHLTSNVLLITLRSEIGETEIVCFAGPASVVFRVSKRGRIICEFKAPFPERWPLHEDATFVFSYSSETRKARTISNAFATPRTDLELSYLDSREVTIDVAQVNAKLIGAGWCIYYERLLGSNESEQLRYHSLNDLFVYNEAPDLNDFPP